MTIAEQLAEALKAKPPKTVKALHTLVRKGLKLAPNPTHMSIELGDYIFNAAIAASAGKKLPVPADFVASSRKILPVKEFEGDDSEAIPEDFACDEAVVSFDIETMVKKLDEKMIKIPEFQRKFVWGKKLSQKFLRTLLTSFPFHNILLATDEPYSKDKRIYVLDGVQRLTTVQKFFKDEIDLGPGKQFNKAKFSDLPKEVQDNLRNKTIQTTKLITKRKFWAFIFRQINKGGMPLNSIEIRRAIYDHVLMLMLDEMAEENTLWIDIFSKNTRFKGLHALIRAVAMHTNYMNYQKPLEQFLDKFCEELPTSFGLEEYTKVEQLKDNLEKIFLAMFKHSELGKNTFKLNDKSSLNLGLVDCLIHAGLVILNQDELVSTAKLGDHLSSIRKKLIDKKFQDQIVYDALTTDTSGKEHVLIRMNIAQELADQVFIKK